MENAGCFPAEELTRKSIDVIIIKICTNEKREVRPVCMQYAKMQAFRTASNGLNKQLYS
jgi:hypothetical protein